MNRPGYVSIDEAQAQTTLQEGAAKCGITLDVAGHGDNVRLDSPSAAAATMPESVKSPST